MLVVSLGLNNYLSTTETPSSFAETPSSFAFLGFPFHPHLMFYTYRRISAYGRMSAFLNSALKSSLYDN